MMKICFQIPVCLQIIDHFECYVWDVFKTCGVQNYDIKQFSSKVNGYIF